MMDALAHLAVVITALYVCVANHHDVNPKHMSCYIAIISQESWGEGVEPGLQRVS